MSAADHSSASAPDADSECCVVGIDVGGTKIAAGVVAFPSGRVVTRTVSLTEAQRGGDAVLRDCSEIARRLHQEAATLELGPVLGIGIGVPELLDLDGNVRSEYSLPWRGVPVFETLSRIAPTVIEMDSTAAAVGEALFGAGRTYGVFLYVTVGTGLGCTLVQNGVPHVGARGSAGVFGNGPYAVSCTRCGSGGGLPLDALAAGPGLVERYAERVGRRGCSAEEVLSAASRGEEAAVEVARSGGRALGVALALLVDALDPEGVVVGGGLGLAAGIYWESMADSLREHVWSEVHRDLPVVRAELGADAGVIGVAATAWRQRRPI